MRREEKVRILEMASVLGVSEGLLELAMENPDDEDLFNLIWKELVRHGVFNVEFGDSDSGWGFIPREDRVSDPFLYALPIKGVGVRIELFDGTEHPEDVHDEIAEEGGIVLSVIPDEVATLDGQFLAAVKDRRRAMGIALAATGMSALRTMFKALTGRLVWGVVRNSISYPQWATEDETEEALGWGQFDSEIRTQSDWHVDEVIEDGNWDNVELDMDRLIEEINDPHGEVIHDPETLRDALVSRWKEILSEQVYRAHGEHITEGMEDHW